MDDSFLAAAVVATYRRPAQLAALLESLAGCGRGLAGVWVADNAADPETSAVAAAAKLPVHYLPMAVDGGCAGGLKAGMEQALKTPGVTHFWILDDDAVARPSTLERLAAGLAAAGADLAVPLIVDRSGFVGWIAGLRRPFPWKVIRRPRLRPADYLELCGAEPVPFSWAPAPSMLVSVEAVRRWGLPSEVFWFQGEDLEFTLRLTREGKGVLVPDAVCEHHPPFRAPSQSARASRMDYLKGVLHLQNVTYLSLRLPQGRRALRHLPGNYFRFLRSWRKAASFVDAARAFYLGGIRGLPAGEPGGEYFKRQFQDLQSSG